MALCLISARLTSIRCENSDGISRANQSKPSLPAMNASHQIVVSAENNPYVAWQCKLFYFSCVTRTSHRPVIIVHDLGGEWHPDFYELARAGCSIYSAPNHR